MGMLLQLAKRQHVMIMSFCFRLKWRPICLAIKYWSRFDQVSNDSRMASKRHAFKHWRRCHSCLMTGGPWLARRGLTPRWLRDKRKMAKRISYGAINKWYKYLQNLFSQVRCIDVAQKASGVTIFIAWQSFWRSCRHADKSVAKFWRQNLGQFEA